KFKGYCTDVFFAAALDFIERNKAGPFFCYLPTNAPHAPYNVAEKYSKPYRDQGVASPRAEFYGMIAYIDEHIAKLVARLRDLGLEEDPIVFSMPDKGRALGGGSNVGRRGFKGSEYAAGHRVPCFLRWTGTLPADKDATPVTAHIDLLPTLAELC